jgi:hypothetical protein
LLIVNESKLSAADKQTVAAIKSGIIQNIDLLKKQGHPKWRQIIIPDEPEVAMEKSNVPVKANDQVTPGKKDAVTYRVQIFSRNYQKKEDQITINDKSYEPYVYSYLGAFRYAIGEFPSLSSATEFQKMCREAGYTEAFVAAFKNNVRSNDPQLFK